MVSLLFGFAGRLGRLEFFLFSCLLGFVAGLLILLVFTSVMPAGLMTMDAATRKAALVRPVLITLVIVGPLFFWFSFALQAKRFRDMGWNPLLAIGGWIGVLMVDKLVALAIPSLQVSGDHATLFGVLFNLGICLCLWFWPSAPGGAGATFDPRIFDENWPGSESAQLLSPSAVPKAPTPAQPAPALAPAPRPGFGRRGL